MQEFWCHFQSQLQLATVVGVTSIWIILRTIISLFARPLSSRGCLPQLTLKVRSRFFLLALCPTSTAVANSLHSPLWFPVPGGQTSVEAPTPGRVPRSTAVQPGLLLGFGSGPSGDLLPRAACLKLLHAQNLHDFNLWNTSCAMWD